MRGDLDARKDVLDIEEGQGLSDDGPRSTVARWNVAFGVDG